MSTTKTAYTRDPFTTLESTYVVLDVENIDTDQIVPARYLKVTDKKGLGEALFADWRTRPNFPLVHADAKGASILVAGENFGCGSSREHAPWALVGFGFRVVVAPSFADIFCQNALKNGLLPIATPPSVQAQIVAARAKDPAARLAVDLDAQTLSLAGGPTVRFAIDAFAKSCLRHGTDELGYLLARSAHIEAYEAKQP